MAETVVDGGLYGGLHSPNHYHNTSGEGHGHCLRVDDFIEIRVQVVFRQR